MDEAEYVYITGKMSKKHGGRGGVCNTGGEAEYVYITGKNE